MWNKLVKSLYLFFSLVIVCGAVYYQISLLWLLPLTFVCMGIMAWASFDIRSGFFLSAYCKASHPKRKHVALTFDDGPTAYTPQFLDILKKHQAKASFFCIGAQLEKYPEIALRIQDEGHLLGNHSQNHPKNMGFLSEHAVYAEIEACEKTFQRLLGYIPNYYRPPFGVTNPNIAKALSKTSYQVVGWNNRSLDTLLKNPQQIAKRIQRKIKAGDIVLMHDTTPKSVLALELLLEQLSLENYTFVTLDELLKM